jgi:hypothetical protein
MEELEGWRDELMERDGEKEGEGPLTVEHDCQVDDLNVKIEHLDSDYLV